MMALESQTRSEGSLWRDIINEDYSLEKVGEVLERAWIVADLIY